MTKLQIALLIVVSIAVGIAAPLPVDFHAFYDAGFALRTGVNPYTVVDYFNPIQVAALYAPLSLLPFDTAYRINAGALFAVYLIALWRLLNRRVFAIAMFAPFAWLLIWTGNIDALVLLGATLPPAWGVWLLLMKPQVGLFAAAIMLWVRRDWRLIVAVVAVMALSLALGMVHGGLQTGASLKMFPWSLLIGLPLLWQAWRKHDQSMALGAAIFSAPYVGWMSCAAILPLFKSSQRVMLAGVTVSWAMMLLLRAG